MKVLKTAPKELRIKRVLAMALTLCLCITMTQIDAFAGMAGTATPGEQTPGEQTPGEQPSIEATGIKLDVASKTVVKGETFTLTATVLPEDAANKSVTWTTSNENIASVAQGKVTAKAVGTATITATTANGKTATCTVTVKAPDATGIKLDVASKTVVKGETFTLTATVLPEDAANKSVTWTTSNKKVAVVDKNGKVTAKAGGTAIIKATTTNGITATCKITVASVQLNTSKITLQKGKSTTVVKIIERTPSKDKVQSYKSSNKKVAVVDKNGKVTAKATGKATITVTMKSGATAKYTVTVQKGKVTTKSVSLDKKSVTLLKGKKKTLTATRNPLTATEKITWSSSDKKVATVDKNGKVTAKGSGKATITAKTANGKKASCKITVPGVTLKTTKATVKVKKTTTIKVKSTVVKGDKVKSYKVSNKKVAKVSSKGVVTGVKKGKAVITVTMKSGATAKFNVTVK